MTGFEEITISMLHLIKESIKERVEQAREFLHEARRYLDQNE